MSSEINEADLPLDVLETARSAALRASRLNCQNIFFQM
jgi:hypothetical protein